MRAVIFDLRDNNGGAGDMVVLLCNHLLEADLLLYTFAGRSDDTPTEMRSSTCAQYFGTAMPVYILTSGNTWKLPWRGWDEASSTPVRRHSHFRSCEFTTRSRVDMGGDSPQSLGRSCKTHA
jgi:hypothetical protein